MAKQKLRGRGEGSVYPRKDGRWAASITLEDGRRKTFYGKTRKEVVEKLDKARYEQKQGMLSTGPQQKLKAYLEQWLEEVHKPSIRLTTYIEHRRLLYKHILPSLGHIQVQKLTPQHVQAMYTRKMEDDQLSPGSVRNIHLILHKALANAVRWNLVSRNVCDLVSPPHFIKREMRVLTKEQAQRLLEVAHGSRLEALLAVAITTGMRHSELVGLRWEDVNLEGASLQVRHIVTYRGRRYIEGEPKTAKSKRNIVLPSLVVEALKKHRRDQYEMKEKAGSSWEERDLVFCNVRGGFLTPNTLRRAFHRLLSDAGLPPMRLHDLRHSAATILLTMGVHPKVVQELLGHSSIAMTLDTYSHVLPSMQKEAMGKMNDLFQKPS